MIARTTWTRLVVLSLGLTGLLLGCGGSNKSKKSKPNNCTPKPKPPPPSLKGCQTQIRLPWTAHRGIDVQTEVKLRLVKEAVRAVVVHRLTVKDQATHWIHDPSHIYNVHDIPNPNPKPAPVSDDCDFIEGRGRFSRVLTSAALKLAPGKPLELSAEPDNALIRGKRLEVMVNASLSGDPKRRPVVPTVDVRVGWTGCPTGKLRATKPQSPVMK